MYNSSFHYKNKTQPVNGSFDDDSQTVANSLDGYRMLRLPAVLDRTGLSRSTIYLRISEGSFPKPVSLGGRAVGWIEAEINAWLNRQIEVSRKAAREGRDTR